MLKYKTSFYALFRPFFKENHENNLKNLTCDVTSNDTFIVLIGQTNQKM